MPETDVLKITNEGAVRILTMSRPDKLNALTHDLLAQLLKAFNEAAKDASVKALILTGSGRGFCSGQELQSDATPKYSIGTTVRDFYNPLIIKMRRIEKPIIAAVNGVAAGAGASLAMACDFRIAAEGASFVQAFSKIGLIPDSGSTFFLPRLIPPTKAFELMLNAEKLTATSALELNLVNKIVGDGEVLGASLELAQQLSKGAGKSYGLIKRAFNQVVFPDLEELLEHEAQLQEVASRTKDFKEGVQAFLEKRPPVYTGS